VADDDDVGRRRERAHDDRAVERGGRIGGGLAFFASALQHRDDDGLAETVAPQRDQLLRLDREHCLVTIDQREDDRLGNARFDKATI